MLGTDRQTDIATYRAAIAAKNALVDKAILEDKSNETQKSHISSVCEKIIPSKIGFNDHMATEHTKNGSGCGVKKFKTKKLVVQFSIARMLYKTLAIIVDWSMITIMT